MSTKKSNQKKLCTWPECECPREPLKHCSGSFVKCCKSAPKTKRRGEMVIRTNTSSESLMIFTP